MKDIGGGLDSQYSHDFDNHLLNAQNIIMTATFGYQCNNKQTKCGEKSKPPQRNEFYFDSISNFPVKHSERRRFASRSTGRVMHVSTSCCTGLAFGVFHTRVLRVWQHGKIGNSHELFMSEFILIPTRRLFCSISMAP